MDVTDPAHRLLPDPTIADHGLDEDPPEVLPVALLGSGGNDDPADDAPPEEDLGVDALGRLEHVHLLAQPLRVLGRNVLLLAEERSPLDDREVPGILRLGRFESRGMSPSRAAADPCHIAASRICWPAEAGAR